MCLQEPGGNVLSCASPTAEDLASLAREGDGDGDEGDEDGQAPEGAGEKVDPPGAPPTSGEQELPPPSDEDYAALAAMAFHRRAFAMPVGLSNVDLGSLDGTATIAGEAAREQMQGLLDRLKDEAK